MRSDIRGTVRLESLRERDSLRINAHLAVFMTPIRWLWSDWPDYIKQGPDTLLTPPVTTGTDFHAAGIGAYNPTAITAQTWWRDAYNRVYNEWYKWPEDPDVTGFIPQDGHPAVPLQHTWNRLRYTATPDDAADYTVGSATDFDVRDLAETQARFKSAMDRDVLTYNRYIEIMKEMYNSDGSREVDQVPIMIDQQEIGVNPRDMPAQDAAGLGEWQSLFDFRVDHNLRGISCPEHCILTYMMVIRFAPLIEGRHPLATDELSWAEQVLDPNILAASQPQEVLLSQLETSNSPTSMGYAPAGWQWRAQHDVIGRRIDTRDSFPYMQNPTTPANAKDATRIKQAFRSQSLGDYLVDLYFHENVKSPINSSMESYMSGMGGSKNNSEFPKQGKML